MKKIETSHQLDASATTAAARLNETAAAAALRLMGHLDLATGRPRDECATVGEPKQSDGADVLGISVLKDRCSAFGIDATTAELLVAGLHLLAQQTETALEVAMLQSLRADRSFAKRRSKRC